MSCKSLSLPYSASLISLSSHPGSRSSSHEWILVNFDLIIITFQVLGKLCSRSKYSSLYYVCFKVFIFFIELNFFFFKFIIFVFLFFFIFDILYLELYSCRQSLDLIFFISIIFLFLSFINNLVFFKDIFWLNNFP